MIYTIEKKSGADSSTWTAIEDLTKFNLNKDSVTETEILEQIEDCVLKDYNIYKKKALVAAQKTAIATAYINTHKDDRDGV